ncbi:leucine--tRNA ligase [Geodermatophilus obscurus]|uniref:Leucine--tRNA ligase n=1 Tax=Geodermatophilus obscurus (strain ATCC 25078 / DSM 43160 / JCM 3152 / CCUG 61914 / KCC A-0152 / KCTC 9177 / NBRC 13315 / NRRL B-3577 / G-20) TaxID=526225 RepID=D2SAT4_GEOOG|nr:leucine--tRNA ligase [Geodermatophilus obscurus]ADB75969.1 leucyl-tRNA synthetase [Geodermatophilus obscurus DSM 43160]
MSQTADQPSADQVVGDVPPHRYTPALAQRIELAWQDRWAAEGTFHTPNPVGRLSEGFERVADRPKAFVMDMFPYPSGAGLHVGHPLGYLGTDATSRFRRMDGANVLHPMGYDAFGLPAEQYAVQTGQHPRITTEANIAAIKGQLRRLGVDHDERRTFATIDPGYYKWTQWIFLQIFGSWFDEDAGRARRIEELVAELDAGTREPAPGTNETGRPWAELDGVERRRVVDAHRLAYLHQAPVNWCPGLGTVLSNEEVTPDGRSERGNFPVFRRPLTQWMMRITAYAERLLADLDRLDWSDSVKQMQRNWIGRSTGARIRFPVGDRSIEVFTTRPDTLFGATYMVLAPEHPMVETLTATAWPDGTDPRWTGGAATPAAAVRDYQRQASRRSELDRQNEAREKTGVWLGVTAVNPVNGRELPVFIADYVLTGYGTGAIMAVPGEDNRDFEFAQVFGLPVVRTVQPPEDFDGGAYTGAGAMINSANDEISLNGLDKATAIATITDWLVQHGHGEATTTYKLRDWLFSRQRYWGEPFPVVYDEDDLPVAVPESMLPVLLPEVDDYSPKTFDDDDADSAPEPPLSRVTDWTTVELDLGEGLRKYRRETNTMPNWAGSCWYYLRYLDPSDDTQMVDPELERYWLGPREPGDVGGVDLYVGGMEHAVLHLLYARFWHKVLHDLGYVSSEEPFRRLVNQGYISAYAYTDERGFYVPAAEVEERDGQFLHEGRPVNREYGKMGKSLKNMVTPDEMIGAYGADTLRVYEMSTGPLEQSRPWETKAVVGSQRLLQRIWRVVVDEETGAVRAADDIQPAEETLRALHRAIAGVRDGMSTLRFNISIARITELTNHLTQAYGADSAVPRSVAEPLVLLVAPLAPHIAEELWARLGHGESLAWHPFPVADERWLVEDTVQVAVQVNGKVRAQVTVPADADAAALEAAARADDKVAAHLDGKTVRRVVAVPGRLVNFVLG